MFHCAARSLRQTVTEDGHWLHFTPFDTNAVQLECTVREKLSQIYDSHFLIMLKCHGLGLHGYITSSYLGQWFPKRGPGPVWESRGSELEVIRQFQNE